MGIVYRSAAQFDIAGCGFDVGIFDKGTLQDTITCNINEVKSSSGNLLQYITFNIIDTIAHFKIIEVIRLYIQDQKWCKISWTRIKKNIQQWFKARRDINQWTKTKHPSSSDWKKRNKNIEL